jgi:REP element-mobilizing transposase RayT
MLLHIVFATKRRRPMLQKHLRPRLHSYIGGICAHRGAVLIEAGSVEDHMHLLVSMPRNLTVADLVRDIKSGSSQWLRTTGACPFFEWQRGYAAFSVSPQNQHIIERYLQRQEQHHAKQSYMRELPVLLTENRAPFNPEYLWDD